MNAAIQQGCCGWSIRPDMIDDTLDCAHLCIASNDRGALAPVNGTGQLANLLPDTRPLFRFSAQYRTKLYQKC
jgi:hypothetical protein